MTTPRPHRRQHRRNKKLTQQSDHRIAPVMGSAVATDSSITSCSQSKAPQQRNALCHTVLSSHASPQAIAQIICQFACSREEQGARKKRCSPLATCMLTARVSHYVTLSSLMAPHISRNMHSSHSLPDSRNHRVLAALPPGHLQSAVTQCQPYPAASSTCNLG
jgi:hypothetical protein